LIKNIGNIQFLLMVVHGIHKHVDLWNYLITFTHITKGVS
jgi:hypothetical protein